MKKEGSILIIDDNKDLLSALKSTLEQYFSYVQTESNPNRIPELFGKKSYDVVLLDMNFTAGVNSGNEGLFWMKEILKFDPETGVIFITAFGDIDLAVKSVKEGAADFLQKTWSEEKILATVFSAFNLVRSKRRIKQLKDKQDHLKESSRESKIIFPAVSVSMKKVMATINKVAGTDANILLLGENGTGKEILAREIHDKSARSNEIFVKVDVGAISENLFESELFGHVKGAFTDARLDKAGRLEVASGGTLFLDEIGNLSLHLQSKLLSALQNREIFKVGTSVPVPIDIRLITATNKSIRDLVEKEMFREDLLYRINTITINIPPLRERKEDIPILSGFFLDKYADKYGKINMSFSREAMGSLVDYSWPGNIRELQHTIEKAVILANHKIITKDEISFDIDDIDHIRLNTTNLKEIEKKIIIKALKDNDMNISLVSRKLGVDRSTLYKKIRKYGL